MFWPRGLSDAELDNALNVLALHYRAIILDNQTLLITPRHTGQILRFGDQEIATQAGVPVRVQGSGPVGFGPGWWDNLAVIEGEYDGDWWDPDDPPPGYVAGWNGDGTSWIGTPGANDLANGITITRTKGNTDSYPEITVKGTLSGSQHLTLTLNGQQVQVTGPLTAAQRLVLDYASMDFGIWQGETKVASAVPRMSSYEQLVLPMGESQPSAESSGTLSEVRVRANSRRV